MFLHGLCATLFLSSAPEGVALPATEAGDSGGILVTLVPNPETPKATPVAGSPAGSPSAVQERAPVSVATAAGGGLGDNAGERAGPDGEAARGAQAASLTAATGSDYRARLLAHIQPYRRYPAQAEALDARGVTQILFMVDQDGRIMGVWVKASSGFEALDNEAMATVLRSQPMPHVPAGLPSPLTVQLPVSFNPS